VIRAKLRDRKPGFAVDYLRAVAERIVVQGDVIAGPIPDVNRHPVLQLLGPCCVLSAGIEHNHTGKETHMNTLTTKLAALAGTLFMNTLVMGAVAYCFALQPNAYMTAVALAKAVATQQGLG
jgi:hypothetical protein